MYQCVQATTYLKDIHVIKKDTHDILSHIDRTQFVDSETGHGGGLGA